MGIGASAFQNFFVDFQTAKTVLKNVSFLASVFSHTTSKLAVSILAGERYIALLDKGRRAIFSLPRIVNKIR